MRDSTAVIGVECNLGFEAHRIIHKGQSINFKRWIALFEGPQNSPGILTTNSTKEIMCGALQELLSSNRINFSISFLSITLPPKQAIQTLVNEMKHFMIVVSPSASVFGKTRRTYSGKASGGQNDDAVIALQLAILTMRIWKRSDKYH